MCFIPESKESPLRCFKSISYDPLKSHLSSCLIGSQTFESQRASLKKSCQRFRMQSFSVCAEGFNSVFFSILHHKSVNSELKILTNNLCFYLLLSIVYQSTLLLIGLCNIYWLADGLPSIDDNVVFNPVSITSSTQLV